jgi:arylsulfatase A-like enzyme
MRSGSESRATPADGHASAAGFLAGLRLILVALGALAVAEMALMAPARDLATPRVWWTVLLMHAVIALGVASAALAATGFASALGRLGSGRLDRVSPSDWSMLVLILVLGFAHGWPLVHGPLEAVLPRPLALGLVALVLATSYLLPRRLAGLRPEQLLAPALAVPVVSLGYYLLRAEPLGLPARSRLVSWVGLAGFVLLLLVATVVLRRYQRAAVTCLVVLAVLAVRAAAPRPHGLIAQPVEESRTDSETAQTEPAHRYPILLIIVDTLRADALEIDREAGSRTPHLAHLATASDVFTGAIANASWTLPGHASLFTGLRASRHRVDLTSSPGYGARLAESVPTVHERMAWSGYATSCISANGIVGPASGLIRGCLGYRHPGRAWMLQTAPLRLWYALSPSSRPALEDQLLTQLTGLRRHATADEVVDLALVELTEPAAPPYLFLNFMDVHKPYPAAPGLSAEENRSFLVGLMRLLSGLDDPETFDHEQVEWYRRSYRAQVSRLDRELGRLFAELRRRGLYDDALIVVTADHGEAFLDNPDLPLYYDHHGAYEPVVRIPLIIKRPGQTEGRRFDHLVEQADIAPAMLSLAAADGSGASRLTRQGGDDSVLTEWNPHPTPGAMSTLPSPRSGLYRGRFKLVFEGDWLGTPDADALDVSLFDLERSPFEAAEVSAHHPRETAELAAELLRLLNREWEAGADARDEHQEPDPELLETLRSLGYIE